MLKKITIIVFTSFFTSFISAQELQELSIKEELKKEGIIFGSESRIKVKQKRNNKLILKINDTEKDSTDIFSLEDNKVHLKSTIELLNNVRLLSKKINILEAFSHSGFYLGFKNSDCDVGTYRVVLIYKQNWFEGSKMINSMEVVSSYHKIDEINSSINKIKKISAEINKHSIEKVVEQELNAILEFICGSNGAIPYNSNKVHELNSEIKSLENFIISHLAYLKIVTLK